MKNGLIPRPVQEGPVAVGLTPSAMGNGAEAGFITREAQKARRYARGSQSIQGVAAVTNEEANLLQRGEPWTPEMLERVKSAPFEKVSFLDLWGLGRCEPAAAMAMFEQMKVSAREDLAGGYNSVSAATVVGLTTPMEAARHLALREETLASWQPQNSLEQMLVEQVVSLHCLFEKLLQEFLYVSSREAEEVEERIRAEYVAERDRERERSGSADDKVRDQWIPPRVNVARAVEQAAQRMDQAQRMHLRALRALRDMRRYTPPVVIQNAGQVNVGQQQVNVTSPDPIGLNGRLAPSGAGGDYK